MNRDPLVSVIIPAYNHEKYVGQCIESIINQSYENIELIILDDGSQDNTFNIIMLYEEKCKKRFVNTIFNTKKNEGVCKTLNSAIKLSSGIYITTIASDDFFLKDKVRKQVEVMNSRKDLMMSWTNGYELKNENKESRKLIYNNYPQFMKNEHQEIFKFILINGNKINNASCMYRRILFDSIGYFDEKINFEDWDFYLRILYKYNITYIQEPLVIKRDHDSNTMKKFNFMFEGDKQTLSKAFADFELDYKEKIKRKAYSNMYLWNAIRYSRNNDRKKYMECIKMSFLQNCINRSLYKHIFIHNPKNKLKKLLKI